MSELKEKEEKEVEVEEEKEEVETPAEKKEEEEKKEEILKELDKEIEEEEKKQEEPKKEIQEIKKELEAPLDAVTILDILNDYFIGFMSILFTLVISLSLITEIRIYTLNYSGTLGLGTVLGHTYIEYGLVFILFLITSMFKNLLRNINGKTGLKVLLVAESLMIAVCAIAVFVLNGIVVNL